MHIHSDRHHPDHAERYETQPGTFGLLQRPHRTHICWYNASGFWTDVVMVACTELFAHCFYVFLADDPPRAQSSTAPAAADRLCVFALCVEAQDRPALPQGQVPEPITHAPFHTLFGHESLRRAVLRPRRIRATETVPARWHNPQLSPYWTQRLQPMPRGMPPKEVVTVYSGTERHEAPP